MREPSVVERECGECSLCCTVLRVDALRKLGGVDCVHQNAEGRGCAIHADRPSICRRYACAWRRGAYEAADRPDRLGAVLDVVSHGTAVRLEIHEARPGAFDASPRLQEIAAQHRVAMPVRISDTADVLDAARPVRWLLPGGDERIVAGDWTEEIAADGAVTRRRQALVRRLMARLARAVRGWRLRDYRGGVRR